MIANAPDPSLPPAEFASFWHGPLDAITYTCLASFPFQGTSLRLYSYDSDLDVPAGIALADARQIVRDETCLTRYIVNGRPSISKFSNYFRYRLLQQADLCWVDADILCLKKPDLIGDPVVIGHQFKADGPWALNNAVLKLPSEHPMLSELSERAAAGIDRDTKWGVLGPLLLTEMARKHGLVAKARHPSDFYPLQFNKFWKALLPGYHQHMVRITERSTFLHIWHEFYTRSGYDKNTAPVSGSFLHAWCERLGTLGRFQRVYERAELRRVLGNFIND